MNRTANRIALLLLLSWTLACAARPPKRPDAAASEPSFRWPIPTGWKHETFALPPQFAPELPYHGSEDLRFMPGFSSPTAPDFWSYDFVWWPDQPPPFDATSLAASLTTYFRGLATAVGGSKYKLDPARYHAVLAPVAASEPPRLTGQIFTYDPFATGLPITLNVEAELRSCPGTRQVAIVVALSPKDTTDIVWNALRATAGTVVCTTYKFIDGKRTEPEGSLHSRSWVLPAHEWQLLQNVINREFPITTPASDGVLGNDGDSWLLEGWVNHRYHAATRWCPRVGSSIHRVGLVMLGLARAHPGGFPQ